MFTREVVRGALGFAAVSVAAFSVWAFAGRMFASEALMYAAVAAVFLGLTGLLLHPLAGGVRPFYATFVPSFLAYAVVWSAIWFAWPTRLGEWAASASASAVLALGLCLRAPSRLPAVAAVLFLAHSTGYFLGGDLYYALKGAEGKLLWGLCYGLGFGAGLGYAYREARRA